MRKNSINIEKKRNPLFLLIYTTLVFIPIILAYIYGPRIYYQLSDNPISRLERRSEIYQQKIISGENNIQELLQYIEDSLKLIDILEKDRPALAHIHYFRGLFNYYNLLLHFDLDSDSLIRLIGREVMPSSKDIEENTSISVINLASTCSINMRRALALDPNLKMKSIARLVIGSGDLFFTARTDPHLLHLLTSLKREEIPPALLQYFDWIALSVFALMGESKRLDNLVSKISNEKMRKGISIKSAHLNYILGFGAFNNKKYLKALKYARQAKKKKDTDIFVQIEATRLEGEIFLNQRGLKAALPYFKKAYLLSDENDPFIKNRIAELESSR